MKKNYEKPMVFFESFELSTSVCGSCGGGINKGVGYGKPLHGTPSTCAWDFNGAVQSFYTGVTGCYDDINPSADAISYCYNAPDGSGAVVFSS